MSSHAGPSHSVSAERVYNNHGTPVLPPNPTISKYLANYVRKDLARHGLGCPTAVLERQVRQLDEEKFQYDSKYATLVAELKVERAKIRNWEIKATHLETKITHVRKMMECIEEKPT